MWKFKGGLGPLALIACILAGFIACSPPSEEPKPETQTQVPTAPTEIPTATPPSGPIVLSFPVWVDETMREKLVATAKEAAGDRDLIVPAQGRNDLSLSLGTEERMETDTSFPWIEENLYLYLNKVLLARAGVQKTPATWEETMEAASKRGDVEGLTAFLALPGDSRGMFRTLSILSALCGATSFSHPEEESVCVAVEAMGELYRSGGFVLDHEEGLRSTEVVQELGRGKAVMALAWESEALILEDTRTSSVASQIRAASPPTFEIHGLRESRQPTRVWRWNVSSASSEDEVVVEIAKRLSEWRGANPPFGRYVDSASRTTSSVVKGGLFELKPPSDHAVRETRRILLEGFKNHQTGLEILQGIQIRYEAIRAHKKE